MLFRSLMSRASAGARISVEAVGVDVERKLAQLPGVRQLERLGASNGHVHVAIATSGDHDLRADVFELAKSNGWTLLELHQESGSIEHLFRELTAAGGSEEGV